MEEEKNNKPVEIKKKPGRPKKNPDKVQLPRNGISENPQHDINIMELEYDSPIIFKKIFNLFKQMAVKEIKMEFDIKSIKIKSSDHLDKNYNLLTINGNKLNHYYCKFPYSIIINPKELDKVFHKIDKNYDTINIISQHSTMNESINIILNNKIISSDEFHIINLMESSEYNIERDIINIDYNNYPIKFRLECKYFKKIISDIASFNEDSHEQIFTIERFDKYPLQISYHTMTKTIKAITIFKDAKKIKLESSIEKDDLFSVSTRITDIKSISNSPISDFIYIFADKEKDIVFKLIIDNGTFELLTFTQIIKY